MAAQTRGSRRSGGRERPLAVKCSSGRGRVGALWLLSLATVALIVATSPVQQSDAAALNNNQVVKYKSPKERGKYRARLRSAGRPASQLGRLSIR